MRRSNEKVNCENYSKPHHVGIVEGARPLDGGKVLVVVAVEVNDRLRFVAE